MGLICSSCHTYNRGSKKYCSKCKKFLSLGKSLKKCRHCDFINPKSVKRCIKCGEKFGFFYDIEIHGIENKKAINRSSASSQKTVVKKSSTKIQAKKVQSANTGIVWKDVWDEFQKLNSSSSSKNLKTNKQSFEQFSPKKVKKMIKFIIWIYIIMMVIGVFRDLIKEF